MPPVSPARQTARASAATSTARSALYGGHGGMVQVFIGTVTFGLISNILQLFGLSTAVQYIVQGAILLLAINLDNLKKR